MRVVIRWLVALAAIWAASQAEAQIAVSEVWHHPDTGDIYALPTNDDSAGVES